MAGKSPESNSSAAHKATWPELTTIRESHGLTLKDIFQATRITIGSLEAIESGEFGKLPPPIYARAYIKSYAKMIGVDEKLLINDYEWYMSSRSHEPLDDPPEIEEQGRYISKRAARIAFVALVSCLIGLLLYHQSYFRVADIYLDSPFFKKTQHTSDVTNSAPMPAVTALPVAKTEGSKEEEPLEKQMQTNVAVRDQARSSSGNERDVVPAMNSSTPSVQASVDSSDRLSISATEETWLRIREDDKIPFQIILKPGEKIERNASVFLIDVGNAGGISMGFQGRTMKNLGKSGEVVHLRLPAN